MGRSAYRRRVRGARLPSWLLVLKAEGEADMTIKLVIADVDGTLLTKKKVLTAATREAVARLREHGIEFSVTSGRPPRGLASLVAPLKLNVALAAFNGGMFVNPDLTTVLSQRTIEPKIAAQAIDYLLSHGLDAWVYQGSDWYIRKADAPRVARERSNVGFDPIVVSDLHTVLDSPVKIVGISEDHDLVAHTEQALTQLLGTGASAARSQPYYLDITHPEANKGMVVREASRMLKIPLEQIATIGDMPNDVPMLHTAGMGIAMGNAAEEVQSQARHVTKSNDDDGFAYAVDNFILGAPEQAHTHLGLPTHTRACVFGLEGVLAQTADLHARAWKQLFDPHLRDRATASGQPYIPFDAVRDYSAYFDARPPAEGVRAFLASRGIEVPDPIIDALVEKKLAVWNELLGHEHLEPYEGSVRYIQAARAAGLRTAVVSSDRHCETALAAAGLTNLFDACIDGVDGVKSYDPYLAAAKAIGVGSEDAVVFEDSVTGVEHARADHFGYVVGVDRVGQAETLRRHGADVVVSDLSALFIEEEGDKHHVA
jgi:Cof subfamily protein (haloacid dehalogenase superfamily)/HAD superfamily hydrolase (TIGR01509 family)